VLKRQSDKHTIIIEACVHPNFVILNPRHNARELTYFHETLLATCMAKWQLRMNGGGKKKF
jgi:hypothetical protein